MKKDFLSLRKTYSIALFVLIIDQLTKYLATSNLNDIESIILIPSLIKLTLTRNSGAAFSILNNSTTFLTFISFIVAIFLIVYLFKNTPIRPWKGLSLSLLLGGTLGNGIDRLILGYVNDFIDLIVIDFPIFNIADVSINLAIICLIIDSMKKNKNGSYV